MSELVTSSLVTDDLLNAIMQAESSGNPRAIGDLKLSQPAYGGFQVREIAFKDVQRIHPNEFAKIKFTQVQKSPDMNRQVARRYLEALEGHYGITDLDSLISGYNQGPAVKRRGIINGTYVRKVKRFLSQPETQ